MTAISKKFALVALCATALTGLSLSAQAATVSLGGNPLSQLTPDPLYGTLPQQNNVVNSGTSGLVDNTSPAHPGDTPFHQQTSATATISNYLVNWYYAGAESGNTVTFTTAGVAPKTEHDDNQNCTLCLAWTSVPTVSGWQFLGQNNTLAFTMSWNGGFNSISNGNTQIPGTNAPSLVFSYLDGPTDLGGGNFIWTLTSSPSDWFAVGLNDGGQDDNHDDMMVFAHVFSTQGAADPGQTPLPAALPLFGSVLGGGLLIGRLRKRRKA